MNKNKFELLNKLDRLDNKSNLSDIQGYIKDMMKINNFNNTPLELFCYLTEEVGELAKEIRKKENNMAIDLNKKYDSSLEGEIADVFIYVLALSNAYKIDLFKALKDKEIKNAERFWD